MLQATIELARLIWKVIALQIKPRIGSRATGLTQNMEPAKKSRSSLAICIPMRRAKRKVTSRFLEGPQAI